MWNVLHLGDCIPDMGINLGGGMGEIYGDNGI